MDDPERNIVRIIRLMSPVAIFQIQGRNDYDSNSPSHIQLPELLYNHCSELSIPGEIMRRCRSRKFHPVARRDVARGFKPRSTTLTQKLGSLASLMHPQLTDKRIGRSTCTLFKIHTLLIQ